MNKRYISGTCLSLSLGRDATSYRHIAFEPQMERGSAYVTDDEEEQAELEAHPYFGTYFEEDPYYTDNSEAVEKEDKNEEAHTEKSEGVVLSFSNESDAKEALATDYGVARSNMRSRKSIEKAAESVGVKINWTDVSPSATDDADGSDATDKE